MSDIREVDRKLAERIADRYGIGVGEIAMNEKRISEALAPERGASKAMHNIIRSMLASEDIMNWDATESREAIKDALEKCADKYKETT